MLCGEKAPETKTKGSYFLAPKKIELRWRKYRGSVHTCGKNSCGPLPTRNSAAPTVEEVGNQTHSTAEARYRRLQGMGSPGGEPGKEGTGQGLP